MRYRVKIRKVAAGTLDSARISNPPPLPPHAAGEHDPPGRDGRAGGEGGPPGVHRPAEEDAHAGRGQEGHAHQDPQPPLRHHEPPAALPPQLPVRRLAAHVGITHTK